MISGSSYTPLHQSLQTRSSSRHRYGFLGQEVFYDQYRPNWDLDFARLALEKAGIHQLPEGCWQGTIDGKAPVVVSIGAGTGSDAALFKKLGCKVILVEPNAKLLQIAKDNLSKIDEGTDFFINKDAMNTTITPATVDLIVIAQALHTLKHTYSEQYILNIQKIAGKRTEELARQHWQTLLPNDDRQRISIWYYNPDPQDIISQTLHELLLKNSDKYRNSQSPLWNAAYFEPNHFQPWINMSDLKDFPLLPLGVVRLRRDQIGEWLSSYSFKPDQNEFESVVKTLQEQWFDKFQQDGAIELSYIGYIAQGRLRADPFPMSDIEYPLGSHSPLYYPAKNALTIRARL